MEEILRPGLRALGIEPPEGAVEALRRYGERLLEKNAVVNLTAIREPEGVARLHLLDSAALLTLADFRDSRVVDVGCGAGFPGVPLKLLCPSLALTAVDSVGKKLDFIRETCAELGVSVECVWGRAEELPDRRERYDRAVSRAVADLGLLAELCLPLVEVGGLFIAMKSPDCGEEVKNAEFAIKALGGRVRDVVCYTIPDTDVTHAAVLIEKGKPTPPQYPRRYAQIKKRPLRG